ARSPPALLARRCRSTLNREINVINPRPAYPPYPAPPRPTLSSQKGTVSSGGQTASSQQPTPTPPPAGSAGAAGYRPPIRPQAQRDHDDHDHDRGHHHAQSCAWDWSSVYATDLLSGRSAELNGHATARPLRAVHVGPVLNRGGAEQWLIE